jgi:uncharacterized membrane protein
MNSQSLKIALAVSVLTNAILAAAVVAGVFGFSQALKEGDKQRQHTPLADVAQQLETPVRAKLKDSMRAVALTAAPDFQEARAARRHAAELAAAPSFDRVATESELIKARAAEERFRARMESGLLDFMQQQTPETRAALAKVLRARVPLRMRPPGPDGGPGGPDGPPPAHDAPPPKG